MNRRAFLLGAIAAPIAAPVIAKAASPVIGVDLARGTSITSVSQVFIGERGAEIVSPASILNVISEVSGIPKRFLTGEVADAVSVDVTFPSLRHPDT